MKNRSAISPKDVAEVLARSRRRCCICFGLYGDVTEKKGQIVHLDRDSSNSSVSNLAFLCLVHHDQYDSRTSQSKGLTIEEVKKYRTELFEFLSNQLQDQPKIETIAGLKSEPGLGLSAERILKLVRALINWYEVADRYGGFGASEEEAAFEVIVQSLGASAFEFCVAVLDSSIEANLPDSICEDEFMDTLQDKIEGEFLGMYHDKTKWRKCDPDALRRYLNHCARNRENWSYAETIMCWPKELQREYYSCLAEL